MSQLPGVPAAAEGAKTMTAAATARRANVRREGSRAIRVPRNLRPTRAASNRPSTGGLALAELRSLARLVQPGLLALDDAGVARQEAGALERHAQVRIHLDERTSEPVTHRAGLAARPAAVDAHADVVGALQARDLQGRQRRRTVDCAREVLLDRPSVEPRR